MDPYLEANWRDVHATLIVYMRDQIQPQLGGPLRARVEERLVVETPLDEAREIYPDVRVFESKASAREPLAQGAIATAEPLVIPCPREEITETFIEILDRSDGDQLVTVIELLSPSNKLRGNGRNQYQRKQQELYDANINMVEIDLTRGGRRELLLRQDRIPLSHQTTFQTCVYRATGRRTQFEIYAMSLQKPLPSIQIPLREQDADARIELQQLIEQAYQNGAYDDIDYAKPPIPPLNEEDAAWAQQLLKVAGSRG